MKTIEYQNLGGPQKERDLQKERDDFGSGLTQWTSSDGFRFFPASKSCAELPPGAYDIMVTQNAGIYFSSVKIRTEGLLRLPEENPEQVIQELQRFWQLRDRYKSFGLPYKRGIFLYGPPGSGKTCVIQQCCADVIQQFGGIVIRFSQSHVVREGLRILRQIEPVKPVILILEDMEELLKIEAESDILNLLDGGEAIDNIVFLATSNYPERLGARIVNRPSRFDRRFMIDVPGDESRRAFLEHLARGKEVVMDIDRWVDDTRGYSMAHLQELFITVNLYETPYDEAIANLDGMHGRIAALPEFFEDQKQDMSAMFHGVSVTAKSLRTRR